MSLPPCDYPSAVCLPSHDVSVSAEIVERPDLLTVIIPVFNERNTISQLLRMVRAVPHEKQVLVVDDGSTDGTGDVLREWENHSDVHVLRHPLNQGKGSAIRTALAYARGRFVIIQDADLEYDPTDYSLLLEPLRSGRSMAVYGSRYLAPRYFAGGFRLFRCGVSALNVLVRILYGVRLTDEATCYKAMETELLRTLDLQCVRFEFCPEVTAKLCRLGVPILEVPIRYHRRDTCEGKKIRWTDGIIAIRELWRWRKWQRDSKAVAT